MHPVSDENGSLGYSCCAPAGLSCASCCAIPSTESADHQQHPLIVIAISADREDSGPTHTARRGRIAGAEAVRTHCADGSGSLGCTCFALVVSRVNLLTRPLLPLNNLYTFDIQEEGHSCCTSITEEVFGDVADREQSSNSCAPKRRMARGVMECDR